MSLAELRRKVEEKRAFLKIEAERLKLQAELDEGSIKSHMKRGVKNIFKMFK